jgi:FMN phosphatase YigB (HAD superfamily)
MIRNIVFDLGNVLISFRPAEYLKKNNYRGDKREKILEDIFLSREWLMLDDGKITIEEAINSIAFNSSLEREEIAIIFSKRLEIMYPIENNTRLLPALKEQGFRLYYLSNFPLDIFAEIKNGYGFFRYFDGGIISSEVKQLEPDESFFIDDIEANVRAAEKSGMKGFHFSGTDSLENKLVQLGLLKVL